jgi:hypothetical protein
VDARTETWLDFPPSTFSSFFWQAKPTGRTWSSGSRYCGFVLSVFDSEGDLLFQGATEPRLRGQARQHPPPRSDE